MPLAESRVSISVHDVAPATWAHCERLIAMLDAIGPLPLTLLIVPDFHRRGCISEHPDFVRAIEARLARGDEVALHGYYHLDEGAPPRNVGDWIERRVLTNREGEFAPLAESEARARIERGLSVMQRLGWPVVGFVAPAWLLGPGAWSALRQFSFSYTTTRNGIYHLPSRDFTAAPAVSYSARSGWRRLLSSALVPAHAATIAQQTLLRFALHPVDGQFERVINHWQLLIERAVRSRTPITKARWARDYLGTMPAAHVF
ncbi:MAG: polysaccharide deacetylase family protein [Betaproteobacteria bacterium]